MIGIALLSHGRMAEGMLDTCELFFGKDIPQITAECLLEGDDPEKFDTAIQKAIEKVDDGHGAIILCDLFGGTPCNRSMMFVSKNVQVIAGMNMPLLLELLGSRQSYDSLEDVDVSSLVEIANDGIKDVNGILAE